MRSTPSIAILVLLCRCVIANADPTLFSDDFSSGSTAKWKQYDGKFSIANGTYQLQSTTFLNDARTVAGDTNWTDYSVDLDYNIIDQGHSDPPTGPSDWPANVLFRVADVSSGLNQGHYYQFILGPTRYEINYVYGLADKVENLGTATFSGFPVHSWHHLTLNVVGDTASAYVDGKNVLTTSLVPQDKRDPRGPSAGAIGLKADDGATVQFDNIRVSSVPQSTPNAQSKFVTVSLRSVANSQHHQDVYQRAGFPISQTGIKIFGGVPFDLLSPAGMNAWDSQFGTVPGVRSTKTLILPVNVFGATNVYTLINTSWGVEGSTTVSLSFVCSDGMHHTVTFKSGDDIRDWNSLSYVKAINERSTQNMTPDLTDRRIDRQQIALPKTFAERTLTKIVLTDSGVTGKDDDDFNKRVLAQRAFLLGLTVETANGNPSQSPSFDDVTQKLLDDAIAKLKGPQAKQVADLKRRYKRESDGFAAQRTKLGDEMQHEVLKVMVLDDKTNKLNPAESAMLKAIVEALTKASKEPDSPPAKSQCKKEILAAVDKNNVWDEETQTRQYDVINAAPAEKRKGLVGVYIKYEPRFDDLAQRESAHAEQYKKDLLRLVVPDGP